MTVAARLLAHGHAAGAAAGTAQPPQAPPSVRLGRPAGEVRQAVLEAAQALATPDVAPTLAELAAHAQVGMLACRRTVSNLVRAELLVAVRERRVPHRNRPVMEYEPAQYNPLATATHELARAMCLWVRR